MSDISPGTVLSPKCGRLYTLAAMTVMLLSLFGGAAHTSANVSDVQKLDTAESRRLLKLAEKLVRKGDLVQAEQTLQKAIEAAGADSLPKLRLAQLYIRQRRYTDAYNLSFPIAKA